MARVHSSYSVNEKAVVLSPVMEAGLTPLGDTFLCKGVLEEVVGI
jgi:hypothetical protein